MSLFKKCSLSDDSSFYERIAPWNHHIFFCKVHPHSPVSQLRVYTCKGKKTVNFTLEMIFMISFGGIQQP